MGQKLVSDWLKQCSQGLHCVHIRSLPVSRTAGNGKLGVPIAISITNWEMPTCTSVWAPDIAIRLESNCERSFWVFFTRWIIHWWLRAAICCTTMNLETFPCESIFVKSKRAYFMELLDVSAWDRDTRRMSIITVRMLWRIFFPDILSTENCWIAVYNIFLYLLGKRKIHCNLL